MSTTTKQSLDALVKRVANTPGFEVKDLGMRWRITNTAGGNPYFLPKRPPSRNTLKGVYDVLAGIGWTEYSNAEEAERERLERIDRDRLRNEARAAEIADDVQRREQDTQRAAAAAIRAKDAEDVGGIRKDVITIDGPFARALLDQHNVLFQHGKVQDVHGRQNRPVDQRLVRYYADQMRRNKWPRTHQGIAIDVTGFLLDGQHRLLAVEYASQFRPDVTFTTEVTYDLPVDAMDYIDQGKKRSPVDVLALHGEVSRLVLASALRLLYLYDNVPYGPEWRAFRMSNDLMLAELDQRRDMRDAVAWGSQVNKVTVASAAATFVYIANRVYRDAPMADFLEGLRTGFNLPPGDARKALQNHNDRIRRTRRLKSDQFEQLALLIKTWNAYLMGTPVQQARFRVDEAFPKPIERD